MIGANIIKIAENNTARDGIAFIDSTLKYDCHFPVFSKAKA